MNEAHAATTADMLTLKHAMRNVELLQIWFKILESDLEISRDSDDD